MNSHFNCLIYGAMAALLSIASAAQTAPAPPQPAVSSVPQKQGWHPVDISQIAFSLLAEEQIIESMVKDLNMSSQQAEELLKSIEIYQWVGLPNDTQDNTPLPMMLVSFRWKGKLPVSAQLLAIVCILRERERNMLYSSDLVKFKKFEDIYKQTIITINEIQQQEQLSKESYRRWLASRKHSDKVSFDTFDAALPLFQTIYLLNKRTQQKCDNLLQQIMKVTNKQSPYISAFGSEHKNYRYDITFLPFIR